MSCLYVTTDRTINYMITSPTVAKRKPRSAEHAVICFSKLRECGVAEERGALSVQWTLV